MNLNYPLLKTFKVDENITDFINKKFDYYMENVGVENPTITSFKNKDHRTGFPTPNLLEWEDEEYQEFLNDEILSIISKEFLIEKERIEYYFNHMLEYGDGGRMGHHNHMHNEDFVMFLYLNTCKSSGVTNFYLNSFNEKSMGRTKCSVAPEKNKGVCFSSLVSHEGEASYEGKRIFVVGFRLV